MARPREGWMKQAACKGADIDIFFPPEGISRDERRALLVRAAHICSGCAVAESCRQYADDLGIDDGVWGGMSSVRRRKARERDERLRRHGIYT